MIKQSANGNGRINGTELGHAPIQSDPTELGHVPIQTISLAMIKPSPENDLLYPPPRADDPDMIALAQSIGGDLGVQEPLLLTRDHYIVSGHRRFFAAGLAGLSVVPCRFTDYCRAEMSQNEFLVLLREHNRQRVKTIDTVAKEEALDINPEDAHQLLLEDRRKR